jgi:pimeloyl-ACP methyl ester carboxylesterase
MFTIVLLPGLDGTGTLFEPLIVALDGKFAITLVSYPKHQALGYDELEAIARQALPTTGEFILLGESFSGPIAISLAASRPAGLIGLVLCCTFARNPRPAFRPLSTFTSILPIKLTPNAILDFLLLGRHATRTLRATLASAVDSVATSVLQARLRAVLTVDVSAKLKTLEIPLLYLQAAQDRVVPATAGREIQELNTATQIVTLNAPHCLLQTIPDEAARAIQTALRSSTL